MKNSVSTVSAGKRHFCWTIHFFHSMKYKLFSLADLDSQSQTKEKGEKKLTRSSRQCIQVKNQVGVAGSLRFLTFYGFFILYCRVQGKQGISKAVFCFLIVNFNNKNLESTTEQHVASENPVLEAAAEKTHLAAGVMRSYRLEGLVHF